MKNDLFSVGAGVAVQYGMLEEEVAVNNIGPGVADGKLKVKGEEWAVQFNLGILIEPATGTRFGLWRYLACSIRHPVSTL